MQRYLRFFATFGGLSQAMKKTYGGILWELRELSVLHRLILAVTGYRDGLPELVLGIWGDPAGLRELVTNMQLRLRQERDRAVLRGALEAFLDQQETQSRVPTVTELKALGFLQEESYSLFEQYSITDGNVVLAHLERENLQNPTYQLQYKDWTIAYLLPRLTENDWRYRPDFRDVDSETLMSDRYRLATTLFDNILWVATDAEDLEALLDRVHQRTSDTLAHSPVFRAANSGWNGKEKVQGFLNMDRIIALGLLSPESEVEAPVRRYLLDLRDHPAVSLDLTSVDRRDRLQLSGRIFRRLAPESR